MSKDYLTTLAGMALAFLGVIQVSMPAEVPWLARAIVGGLTAAIGVPLGYTHSRTRKLNGKGE